MARLRANVAALRTLRALESEQRAATSEEQATLARWSGWGSVPAVFDPKASDHERFAWARTELEQLLSPAELAAAKRNTLNAHYTDAGYVEAIWGAVRQLGFAGGHVLEPGCGSGNFMALAGEGDSVVGVELDPVTAGVAAALYPHARVRAESFADTNLPEGSFDLTIGNVPFGDVTLHDRRHNAGQHRIHNHFILKSLHLTRPGGLVAVITSRYTMDSANPSARREMAELADLVGAVRLPTGAHRRAAGTDVVTDVLLFRRRAPGAEPEGLDFEQSRPLLLDGASDELRINEYFLQHREHVLGELAPDQGDRGRTELGVRGDRQAAPALEAALTTVVERARERGLCATTTPETTQSQPVAHVSAAKPEGTLSLDEEGFRRVEDGRSVRYKPPSTQAAELRALLGLRDTAVALLEAEASTIDDTPEITELRAELNRRYERYVAAHGPINRFSERRTGRVDPTTGEEQTARVRPRQGGFRVDPYANVVFALEHFDASTQSATKATIFRERVIARRTPQLGADTPEDALAICLDTFGEARLSEIARLLGVEQSEARERLGTLVFDEPDSERIVPAAEYLSGNVRTKLAHASRAAAHDARFAPNVEALTAVLPRDLTPEEIHANLGAAWIGRKYVEQFLGEILDDPTVRVEHPGGSTWMVKSARKSTVAATTTWGTERCSAIDLAQALLEQRQLRIYDESHEGERVFNPTETIAANEKAKQLSERFSAWAWEHPERAEALARLYNDRFNAIVPRSYDGSRLTLPGLALCFKPRPHQLAAVARVINEPAVGLFHEVGAGKTAEMVMSAMELRRLGLAKKPVVVIPNHMLEQFSREWLQLYPQARILAASKEDLDRDSRRLFVARCATNDWDAIVMTRSAFERIPMSNEAQAAYLTKEVDAVTSLIERAKANDATFSLKRLERMRMRAEERLKQKLDGAKDPGLTFEQLGIDYIFVDEAHAYKNLRTASNIPGMAVDGSQRASDLHMKLDYLREKHGRVGTLATATPIANSMGEAYTMQRYLRPDLLRDAGITDFDQWAATFGETATAIEVAPDGSGMRMQTRFAKFRNVPELLLQWRVSADIKTAEDLQLPVPLLAPRTSDGERAPEVVVVPPSPELEDFVHNLGTRAEHVRSRMVKPHEDNMLAISSDGRAAGLDLRLLDVTPEQPQKVDVAAARIAEIYRQSCDKVFDGPDGQPHSRPGALQLVFSDLGTPKTGAWSVYEQLRDELVRRGVPRETVRFIHEARNDREKGELFAACRDGRVAVLIGSTERMGVGTNVQLRAVALHHLDCPWRPADIAQREGRILRQGNANAEVQILRYVTEGSFDGYLWQTVARKAQFIGQVMRGRLDVREIQDLGDAALSYNEVKALATGNPLLLEQAEAQAEVERLERLERAHARGQHVLSSTIEGHTRRIQQLSERILEADRALEKLAAFAGRPPAFVVGARAVEKRADAHNSLKLRLSEHLQDRAAQGRPVVLGSLQGFHIVARAHPQAAVVHVELRDVPGGELSFEREGVGQLALLTRLENRLASLPALREDFCQQQVRLRAEIERARAELGAPFRYAQELRAERERLRQLNDQIQALAEPPPRLEAPLSTDPAIPAAQSDEAIEGRWQELIAHEVSRIRRTAHELAPRLEARRAHLRSRLKALIEAKPSPPGPWAKIVGAAASHEDPISAWAARFGRAERTLRDLERKQLLVRAYQGEPGTGRATRLPQLASKRLSRREPDLARQLLDVVGRRQVAERERVLAAAECDRVVGAVGVER